MLRNCNRVLLLTNACCLDMPFANLIYLLVQLFASLGNLMLSKVLGYNLLCYIKQCWCKTHEKEAKLSI